MTQTTAPPAGRSRFVSNTAALGAMAVTSTLLALVQVKILAVYLPQGTFGLFVKLRGLSLLVSMLAANGLPQLLLRYLPVHESHRERRAAVALTAACAAAATALTVVLLAGLHNFRGSFMDSVPAPVMDSRFLLWFYATTLGVTLKLVLYGGLGGLRRLGAQTWLESVSLLVQVAWIFALRDRLGIENLFMVLGSVSLATVAVGTPWFIHRLRLDTFESGAAPARSRERTSYGSYWVGATGLSLVAIAFTDVDRYVLSGVLALETLSLFHIGSRVVRLSNRFMGIPVLAFQPEVSRLDAEDRRDDVAASTRVFMKFNIVTGLFVAAGVAVFASELIRLVANNAYLEARPLLLVLAASIPLTAMTAPLTAVMKALDDVRRAFFCDLAWALTYLVALVVLGRRFGLIGAGYAHVLACVVQLLLAARLGRVAMGRVMARTLPRGIVACVLAFAAPLAAQWLPLGDAVRLAVRLLLLLSGVWVFRWALLALGTLDPGERSRLADMLGRAGTLGRYAGRLLT